MPFLATTVIMEVDAGSSPQRVEAARRLRLLGAEDFFHQVFDLPDLTVPTTKTIYDWANNDLKTARGVAVVLDPRNAFQDNAASPPLVNVEINVTDTDGSTAPVSLFSRLRRDSPPIVLPGQDFVQAISDAAAANKLLRFLRARNIMATGFGNIEIEVLMGA